MKLLSVLLLATTLLPLSLHTAELAPGHDPVPVVVPVPVQVTGVTKPGSAQTPDPAAQAVVVRDNSQVWVLVITSLFTLLGSVFTGIMAYLMARLNAGAKVAAIAADVQAARSTETLKTVNAVHTLVNHNMRVALATAAVLARRVAELTKKPADVKVADAAELRVVEHDKAQADVDLQNAQALAQPVVVVKPA